MRELLGGYRDTLTIISIGGYYMPGKKLADFGNEVESYRKAGMAGFDHAEGRSIKPFSPSDNGPDRPNT